MKKNILIIILFSLLLKSCIPPLSKLYIKNLSSEKIILITKPSIEKKLELNGAKYDSIIAMKINNSPEMHRATMKPYSVFGVKYYPEIAKIGDKFDGIASWYGPDFHSKKTSNGEIYNMYDMTAAHKTLPMNTVVRVDNLENGKSTIVRINDRGPFVAG